MRDLISRCELFNRLASVQTLGEAYGIIQGMDTVDAVSVRHGRWITHHEKVALLNGEAFGGVYCSECGFKTHNKLHVILGCPFKYCPHCGARMDGKGNGDEAD